MIRYKHVTITWESGTIEVFPRATSINTYPTHVVVKQEDMNYLRSGKVKDIRVI